jgi:3-dehydroquinate dehydratase/shikimate dehydrogenase
MATLKTERLILRPWALSDLEPFAKLNADPRVMEYFPATLSKAESDQLAERIQAKMDQRGWGIWAVSLSGTSEFIGFIGLNDVDPASFPAPFAPAVEVGWRIAFEYWGKGYGAEGAKAALAYGFETLKLGEIVSFAAVQNVRSRRLMERIGMHSDPSDDFDHPKLPAGHPLRRQVLYRLKSEDWQLLKDPKKKYVYHPYSKIFPELFQKQKARIAASLPCALAIEHVGSTSIPGLGGKGIIDIAIAVAPEDLKRSSAILQELGFQFRPSFSTPDRLYFIAYLPDPEEGTRRYHIHLTYLSSKEWKELVGFREYLLSHPEAVAEYASLKQRAALLADQDGRLYRKAKEPLFQKAWDFIQKFLT